MTEKRTIHNMQACLSSAVQLLATHGSQLTTHFRRLLLCLSLAFTAVSAHAGEMNVTVEIPALDVAEYHRPYVAIWVEHPDHSVAADLAVWYQTDPKKEDGTQWLKDLRQWWRRSGRSQKMPIDGVTGATRPVGEHALVFNTGKQPLAKLPAGKYALVVESVREVGGRELLRLPFELPATDRQRATLHGKTELGAVTLELTP